MKAAKKKKAARPKKGVARGRGRPTKYKPEFVGQAVKLCGLGATDVEIADIFKIDVRTLYRWKAEHEDFCHVLDAKNDAMDARVERSLFARATGYEAPDTDVRVIRGKIVKTPLRKHFPPDTTAAAFWLKNRKPDEWRDKSTLEVTGDVAERMKRADARLTAADADD